MQPSPEEEARRWFAQAEHDLEDGRFNGGGRHNVAAFVAQQAAEKVWKAFLFAQGVPAVRGHSVWNLGEEALQHDLSLGHVARAARPLDQYYIPTRCPNGLPPGGVPSLVYNDRDSSRAVTLTEQVLAADRLTA